MEQGWARLLACLAPAVAIAVHDVAFPIELTSAGLLRIGVRKELWRHRVRETLGDVDLGAALPGARNVEIVSAQGSGRTGREVIAEADQVRRAAARAAAEASEPIQKLIQRFGAELEEVTAFAPSDAADLPPVGDDAAEDYGVA